MFGYVKIYKSELKVKEVDLYNAYYCGICKSIGRRYGQIPRVALSYDVAFLAIVLDSIDGLHSDRMQDIRYEHCIIHPIRKNPTLQPNEAMDYAADMMIILAYHKMLDDKNDSNRIRGSVGATLLKKAYVKVQEKYPSICENVQSSMNSLALEENKRSGSLDKTASCSGKVLGEIFSGFSDDEVVSKVLFELGDSIGRWVYIVDALDDFEKDNESDDYNPFKYRKEGIDNVDVSIYEYMARISSIIDLLDINRNKGIIDNIVMLGMRKETDRVLEGE